MLVLIDKYVPFIHGVLESQVSVEYLEPEEFTPQKVRHADALIIRTRTKCNAALLDGSSVRFIATATIGYDHIDREYCESHGIYWTNCPGCNAQAVCDYVEEAITYLQKSGRAIHTIGVVGVGHVGSLVVNMAERHGLHVLTNDPPLGMGVSLDELAAEADVITFHTPLVREGEWPTYHLCNRDFLRRCKPNAVIINAARGGIVNEEDMINSALTCIIDTWEGEPHINTNLLEQAELATFHIAGYSLQGKINASNTCLSELCAFFGLSSCTIDKKLVPLHGDSDPGWIERITATMKSRPNDFEILRKTYKLR